MGSSLANDRRTGGQLIVDMLAANGVDTVFSVAGESYLAVLDAFCDVPSIKVITCRHESGAGFMAEAWGKLTNRPGVAMVTRGPGACNASIAVHTAFQDSTPMVLLVGQVARGDFDREAFQEIDYRRMFGSVAKWVAQIDQTERVPEYMHRAFHVAMSGRPGPVVLALPEDMLTEAVETSVELTLPAATPVTAHPGPADIQALMEKLRSASKPMLVVGGSGWTDDSAAQIARFAEVQGIPVCCSFRRQDIVYNDHPGYGGDLGTGADPALKGFVSESDLLLVIGARLGEITTQGYTLLSAPKPDQGLVHIHPCGEETGRVYHPDLAIQSGVGPVAEVLAGQAAVGGNWSAWRERVRGAYEKTLVPQPLSSAVDPGALMMRLRDLMPEDAIITVDAGNFSGWPQRFLNFGRPGRQLGPTAGSMGYSVPAGVAAQICHPDRLVISFVGDGGALMTGQELATAVHHEAPLIIIVFNNGIFGTIRMHQERHYPGRLSATDLTNPDFAEWARTFGAHGERVERTEDFEPAFARARASGKPAVIELLTDPEVISTRTTITALRQASLQ